MLNIAKQVSERKMEILSILSGRESGASVFFSF